MSDKSLDVFVSVELWRARDADEPPPTLEDRMAAACEAFLNPPPKRKPVFLKEKEKQ